MGFLNFPDQFPKKMIYQLGIYNNSYSNEKNGFGFLLCGCFLKYVSEWKITITNKGKVNKLFLFPLNNCIRLAMNMIEKIKE